MHFKILSIFLFLLFCNNTFLQNNEAKKLFAIGEIVELESTILNEKRTLNIYLPEDQRCGKYHTST